MDPITLAIVVSLCLFIGMMVCLEIGYRIGEHSSSQYHELSHEGIGVIEAAIFALLGLLLGFSFSGGISRLEARRQLIVQEVNAIGTAYLRLDELPDGDQPGLRHLFRDYIDSRLSFYQKMPDMPAVDQELARGSELQQQIWMKAIAAARNDPSQNVSRLVLPALNEMFDVATARTVGLRATQPRLIFFLLISVALLSALLAGHAMEKRKARSILHMILFSAVIAITLYTILDLEYPRSGLIRLDSANNALVRLRDSIH